MTKVWLLYAENTDCDWVLAVYASKEVAVKAWENYRKTNSFDSTDLTWWVSSEVDWAIKEYEIKGEN